VIGSASRNPEALDIAVERASIGRSGSSAIHRDLGPDAHGVDTDLL
jgi:hypothetical protein